MPEESSRELSVPPGADSDPSATELARVWAVHGEQHAVLRVDAWVMIQHLGAFCSLTLPGTLHGRTVRSPVDQARELIVLELYRQGEVSSGRAAQLLGMEREGFIRYASQQGIPYFQLQGEELQREIDASKKL